MLRPALVQTGLRMEMGEVYRPPPIPAKALALGLTKIIPGATDRAAESTGDGSDVVGTLGACRPSRRRAKKVDARSDSSALWSAFRKLSYDVVQVGTILGTARVKCSVPFTELRGGA